MPTNTPTDFKEHLKEQLYFLEKSIQDFDKNEIEAKRSASTLRTLLHDTSNSTSLLKHLNSKSIKFIDTSAPEGGFSNFDLANIRLDLDFIAFINNTPYAGLVAKEVKPHNGNLLMKFKPLYKHHNNSSARMYKDLDFDVWWNSKIFDSKTGYVLTRKDLILALANKDGGAHIDDKIDERYKYFKSGDLIIMNVNGVPQGFQNIPSYSSALQIAWETLHSIKRANLLL